MLALEGIFKWDGLTDEGQKARIGIYIVIAEIFSSEKKSQYFKKTCVVAGKLDLIAIKIVNCDPFYYFQILYVKNKYRLFRKLVLIQIMKNSVLDNKPFQYFLIALIFSGALLCIFTPNHYLLKSFSKYAVQIMFGYLLLGLFFSYPKTTQFDIFQLYRLRDFSFIFKNQH